MTGFILAEDAFKYLCFSKKKEKCAGKVWLGVCEQKQKLNISSNHFEFPKYVRLYSSFHFCIKFS